MLWYVLGLVGMFYLGYLIAALFAFSRRLDDAENSEIREVLDCDGLIYEMQFIDPHDTDQVIKTLQAGAREIERLTQPCPVHGDEPCIRWFLRKACGHCTADDMIRYIAEGRAEMIQGTEQCKQQRRAP